MTKRLDELSLLDIAPGSITGDVKVQDIIGTLDPQIQKAARNIANVLIYSRIDELLEPVIDALAWQWHVDFYEPDLPLGTKRDLVRASVPWHRIKGTPAAVEQMISTVFGNSWLTEWFETAPRRRPYTFRLAIDLDDRTPDMDLPALANLRRIVECAKNTRSFLELIELFFHMEDKIELGDSFPFLSPIWGYEDAYPYPLPIYEHNGDVLHGGSFHRNGGFLHDGELTRSSLIPGWWARGGSGLRIDDLYLAFHTSLFDDVSDWGLAPEFAGGVFRDGAFPRDGLLSRDGLKGKPFFHDGLLCRGDFTRNRLTLPLDWFLIPLVRYTPEDEAPPEDSNGVLEIRSTARRGMGVRRDGRAARGMTPSSGPLDGMLSIQRTARNGKRARDGEAVRQHDALAAAA